MSIGGLLGGLFPAGGAVVGLDSSLALANQQAMQQHIEQHLMGAAAGISSVARTPDTDRGGPALPNGSVVPRAVVKAAEELVRALDLRLDGAAEVTIIVPRQSGLAALLPPQGLLLAPGLRVFGEES